MRYNIFNEMNEYQKKYMFDKISEQYNNLANDDLKLKFMSGCFMSAPSQAIREHLEFIFKEIKSND